MLNGIMTAISILTILGGAYIVAEAFVGDRVFRRIHKRTDEIWVGFCNGIARCLGVKPDQPSLSAYERDCKKYADTLPAFSEETKRIMQREGHWPEPRRDFFGNQAIVDNILRSQHGIWSESPHYGLKAPGLMRVWPNGYPPSTAMFHGSDTLSGEKPTEHMKRRYGQIVSVKPNNETEAMRQMKALQDKVRKLNSAGVYIGYDSHPMDKSPYAPRIVREVVEVEEIEITSKSSSKVIVEGFERRYYEPIEEPDISRILLDKS